jgi:hypothetical protein
VNGKDKVCSWIVGHAVMSCALMSPCFASQPLAGLLGCRAVTQADARLACFDRESAAIDPKAAAAAVTSPAVAASPPDPKKQFGLPERTVVTQEVAAGARAADAVKVEAHVLRLSTAANGHLTLALDNDQVWRQLANSGDLLLKPGDAVTIARASLGSFWLQTGTGRGCKVSRVR